MFNSFFCFFSPVKKYSTTSHSKSLMHAILRIEPCDSTISLLAYSSWADLTISSYFHFIISPYNFDSPVILILLYIQVLTIPPKRKKHSSQAPRREGPPVPTPLFITNGSPRAPPPSPSNHFRICE